MRKGIIGIFVCMLLIASTALPVLGNIQSYKIAKGNIVNIELEKCEWNREEFLNESFDGTFPPDGWTTDDFIQSNSNYAGGTSPEAKLYWSKITEFYSYLKSKPVDTSTATTLSLEFKSFLDDFYGGYICKILARADSSETWTDVTPWSNPVSGDIGPDTYIVDITSAIGEATEIMFEFDGYYYDINYWYIDDIRVYRELVEEDTIPPTTIEIVGEPKYGEDDYWINASTQISFTAIDNPGGSGVDKIYFRVGDDNGMGEWAIYTAPFQILGTSGNYRYYIEYYAVDNAGNEEDVHNQEHIVDNALPLTILDIDGSCSFDSDHIHIKGDSNIVFCSDDTCCRKIDSISIEFNYDECWEKRYKLKDGGVEETSTVGFEGFELTVSNSNGAWIGNSKRKEGKGITIDIPDKGETCKVDLTLMHSYEEGKPFDKKCEIFNGNNIIQVNCEWLHEQAKKSWQAEMYSYKVFGPPPYVYEGYVKFRILFECKDCPVKHSGLDVTQYNIAYAAIENEDIQKICNNEWITYTGPFTIPEEGLYNIQYRSIDNLGQTEPIKTTILMVDNTAPTTPELLIPLDNDMTNAIPFFDWEETEDDPSGIVYILQISSDQSFNNIIIEEEILYCSQYTVDIEDILLSGVYYWRLRASDFVGNADEWSETRSFTVKDSNAPNKPDKPSGKLIGEPGVDYTYTTSASDPENDKLYYNFSWGDSTYSGWFGPFDSGQQATCVHNWTEKGSYEIKVKAIDEYGKQSDWSELLVVTVPKNKAKTINTSFFLRFLENFPILYQLL